MRKRLISILVLTAALLLMGSMVAYAQGPDDGETILLLLPVPQPDTMPSGVETAEEYAHRAAQPVLRQLAALRADGLVHDFELLADRHAIRVTVTDAKGLRALRERSGAAAIRAMDAAGLACASKGAQAVGESLRAIAAAPADRISILATDPSISVYVSPSGNYGSVGGTTTRNTAVTMTLRSESSALKATKTTTSSSSGGYSFSPDWQTCIGYDWYPIPGDSVEVTAAGNTVSTTVVSISAFADPTSDTVTGTTEPNRTVTVSADQTNADCEYTGSLTTTTSDGSGTFSAPFPDGFDRSVSVDIYVRDANENSTHTYLYPPRISLAYDGDPSGYLKPNVGYAAALKRGGSTVSAFGGTTDNGGSYSGSFTETMQAGDVIEVSGGGLVISTTFVEVSDLAFDLTHGQISGSAGSEGAGLRVRISASRSWQYECGWDYDCATDTASGTGAFSLHFGEAFHLRRGDYAGSPAIYDDEGNYQRFRGALTVPIIEVEPYVDAVSGWWREPGVAVTMTLRDSGGAAKNTYVDTTSSYSAYFFARFEDSIEPEDGVDVSDGAYTMTVSSVPTLTAYLDASAGGVSGSAPGGSALVARLWHFAFDPEYGHGSQSHCYTGTVSGGSYTVDFSDGIDAGAEDYAYVYHTDPAGHKIEAYSHAFAVNAEKGGDFAKGHTPAPDTQVIIELRREGSAQAVITATSSSDYGAYDGHLSSGTPVTITEGDTVTVKAGGTITYNLVVPELTVGEDAAENRVIGRAPPNANVTVRLRQPATAASWVVYAAADADGDYVADFDGVYDGGCALAQVGACTRPKATYYNEDGHTVYVWGPEPASVSADGYEPDDAHTTASAYGGIQSHTFHTVTDTDWISFTVSDADVGTPYYLQTVSLGVNANTELYLYDTDGANLLDSDPWGSPASSEIVWTASAAGTYYVEVTPHGSANTKDCGSTYDFFIARNRVYLPLIMRGY